MPAAFVEKMAVEGLVRSQRRGEAVRRVTSTVNACRSFSDAYRMAAIQRAKRL